MNKKDFNYACNNWDEPDIFDINDLSVSHSSEYVEIIISASIESDFKLKVDEFYSSSDGSTEPTPEQLKVLTKKISEVIALSAESENQKIEDDEYAKQELEDFERYGHAGALYCKFY